MIVSESSIPPSLYNHHFFKFLLKTLFAFFLQRGNGIQRTGAHPHNVRSGMGRLCGNIWKMSAMLLMIRVSGYVYIMLIHAIYVETRLLLYHSLLKMWEILYFFFLCTRTQGRAARALVKKEDVGLVELSNASNATANSESPAKKVKVRPIMGFIYFSTKHTLIKYSNVSLKHSTLLTPATSFFSSKIFISWKKMNPLQTHSRPNLPTKTKSPKRNKSRIAATMATTKM